MTCKVLLSATVGWPSVARYAGGFAAAGCEVHALSPSGAPVCVSRYVRKWHRYTALGHSLARAIEACAPDLIVACDDRAVAHMVALHARTRDSKTARLIERSLGSPQNFGRIASRAGSLAELRSAGILTPETVEVADLPQLDAALSRIGYPAVLKSDGSWGGEGVVIARDRDEAHRAFMQLSNPPSRLRSLLRAGRRRDAHFMLDALAPAKRRVCVQEFISGKAANSAFAAWQGEVIATVYYDVLVADAEIGPPNVIRRVDCPQMDRASRAAARLFGLSGFHGIDFIRDSEGNAYAIEINPRATQGGTLAFGAGHDLPSALASMAFQRPATMRKPISGDIVALFPREWRRDANSIWLTSGHHDVPWDDPAVLMATLGHQVPKNEAVVAGAIAKRSLEALAAV